MHVAVLPLNGNYFASCLRYAGITPITTSLVSNSILKTPPQYKCDIYSNAVVPYTLLKCLFKWVKSTKPHSATAE